MQTRMRTEDGKGMTQRQQRLRWLTRVEWDMIGARGVFDLIGRVQVRTSNGDDTLKSEVILVRPNTGS